MNAWKRLVGWSRKRIQSCTMDDDGWWWWWRIRPAIPGALIRLEASLFSNSPRTQLVEAADQAGAARASIEPKQEWGGGGGVRGGGGGGGGGALLLLSRLVEHVEESRAAGVAHRQVTRTRWQCFMREFITASCRSFFFIPSLCRLFCLCTSGLQGFCNWNQTNSDGRTKTEDEEEEEKHTPIRTKACSHLLRNAKCSSWDSSYLGTEYVSASSSSTLMHALWLISTLPPTTTVLTSNVKP